MAVMGIVKGVNGSGGSEVVQKTLSVINGTSSFTVSELSDIAAIQFWYGTISSTNEVGFGVLNNGTLEASYSLSATFDNGVRSISGNTFTFKYNSSASLNFYIVGN